MKDMLSNIESQLLVMAANNGNPAALEKLVSLWQKKLWRYVFGLTNDAHASWDITQQSWLEIIKGLKKLRDPKNFKAWAYKIATNRSMDWLRNKNKNQYISLESIEVDYHQKEDDVQVKELIQRLKKDSRAILSLYYFEQLRISEMGKRGQGKRGQGLILAQLSPLTLNYSIVFSEGRIGDQHGHLSCEGLLVSLFCPVPSAFIM